MAELSYWDVQRAVQEGLRTLQDSVQRLTSNVGSVSTRADHIGTIETTVREMQRTTQLMQQNLNTMRLGSGSGDPRIAQMAHDIYELKVRFAAIERFIQQSNDYIQTKMSEEAEDNQYRNL